MYVCVGAWMIHRNMIITIVVVVVIVAIVIAFFCFVLFSNEGKDSNYRFKCRLYGVNSLSSHLH